ncbi:MAG: MEKHLA domain-containing protein [Methylococcales bacterium]|nr:MEKHLA domain-containing protein [Methylococcales bacterium]
MNYFPNPPGADNHYLADHIELITHSFQHLLGYPLLSDTDNIAERLYHAPFVLLSHNTDADPIFNYANAQGLQLFELNWQQLITLPSRVSAEPINQAARAELMHQVTTQGFITDYQGVRISKTGKRFAITNAIVWNLTDSNGVYQGQAAYFSDWTV